MIREIDQRYVVHTRNALGNILRHSERRLQCICIVDTFVRHTRLAENRFATEIDFGRVEIHGIKHGTGASGTRDRITMILP